MGALDHNKPGKRRLGKIAKNMKYNKGFLGTGIIITIIALLAIGGGAYYAMKTKAPVTENARVDNYQQVEQNYATQQDKYSNITQDAKSNNQLVNNTTNEQLQPDTCPPSSSPSITILSPNGGETYQAGEQVVVRWTSCNVGDMWLGLASGGKNFGQITYPNPIPASAGEYLWTVSNPAEKFTGLNTNSYQIVAESQSPDLIVKSGTFTVQ